MNPNDWRGISFLPPQSPIDRSLSHVFNPPPGWPVPNFTWQKRYSGWQPENSNVPLPYLNPAPKGWVFWIPVEALESLESYEEIITPAEEVEKPKKEKVSKPVAALKPHTPAVQRPVFVDDTYKSDLLIGFVFLLIGIAIAAGIYIYVTTDPVFLAGLLPSLYGLFRIIKGVLNLLRK